jgi:SAM-dependent methyltransferase
MSTTFNLYSYYYDLLYQDKNYLNESHYVDKLIKANFPLAQTVLEIGMGTGKHAEILRDFGYVIEGIELSESMAEIARLKGLKCTVSNASNFEMNKKFDIFTSLFHVISYITDNHSLIETFKRVNNHLNNSGIFIFDVWYTPAVLNFKPETRIKRLENELVSITRIAESIIKSNENIVDVNYEIIISEKANNKLQKINETHSMRHFSIPEIKLLCAMTGFELVSTEEWLSGNEPSENSWGVCFILKKI